MKAPFIQIARQLQVINILQNRTSPVSSDELFDRIATGCSIRGIAYPSEKSARRRLLERDIKSISENMYIDISNVRSKGYLIIDRGENPDISYEKLFADFDLLTAVHSELKVNEYIFPDHHRGIGSANLFPLLDAIRAQNIVEFDYKLVRKGGKTLHYSVQPYFLKENQQRWYLVAVDNGTTKLFGLDRISRLEITEDKFKRDSSISAEELFDECYGIWNDLSSPLEEIELKYDALDGAFLKSVPLHSSQKVIVDNDREFRITVRLRITRDFIMTLLSRSRSVEVIKPLHLRKDISQIAQECADRNKIK